MATAGPCQCRVHAHEAVGKAMGLGLSRERVEAPGMGREAALVVPGLRPAGSGSRPGGVAPGPPVFGPHVGVERLGRGVVGCGVEGSESGLGVSYVLGCVVVALAGGLVYVVGAEEGRDWSGTAAVGRGHSASPVADATALAMMERSWGVGPRPTRRSRSVMSTGTGSGRDWEGWGVGGRVGCGRVLEGARARQTARSQRWKSRMETTGDA